MRARPYLLSLPAALALLSCNAEDAPFGLGVGPAEDESQLDLAITDAPVDDVAVVALSFTGVELQRSNGEVVSIDLEPARRIDLVKLRGGNTALLLDDRDVPAGGYQGLRLLVSASTTGTESFVDTTTGGRFPLTVPGDSALQFTGDFSVPTEGSLDLLVDVDLRRGLTRAADQDYYLLRPALRLIDADAAGAITGTVADSRIGDVRCTNGDGNDIGNVVYVFSGVNALVGDIGSGLEPLTTAEVVFDGATSRYRYRVPFLPAGAYTLAFTCQAADDDPLADDDLLFFSPRSVTLSTDETETADL